MRRATMDGTLAVGFLAVAAAAVLAREAPASTYEASIYTGTPAGVWVGLAVALAVAVGVTLVSRGRDQALGIALGATVVTAIVSLPVIRNYRFSGMGDGLTHLGWTRDIVAGDMLPIDLFYPAVHSLGAALHVLAGVAIERALLFTVILLFVPFLVFAPLVVREFTGNATAVGLAAIVSWMVLPVNNVATHVGVHTNSNALFLVPVALFALAAYLRRRATIERLPFGLSPYSALVYLVGIVLLLVHPQQMINVVILVAAFAVVQSLARYRLEDHPIVDHPSTSVHALVLGAIFTVWTATNERFRSAVVGLLEGLFTDDVSATAAVGQRGSSLLDIGGSVGDLFVTMFLEAAVIGLLVGLFVLLTWLGWTAVDPETWSFVTYVGAAMVPLGGLFLVYFVGTPTMAFRQLGFLFVLVTILAGVALAHLVGGLSRVVTTPGATAITALALGAFLVLGLMTVYASPIIYDPGQHVTDRAMSGYESSFDHAAEDRPHVGLGYDPYRYDHGIYGLQGDDTLSGATIESGEVDPDAFEAGEYGEAYRGVDYYLALTEYDVTREVDVYQELSYSEAGLEGLDHEPGVDKVLSNDEFELYAVESEG